MREVAADVKLKSLPVVKVLAEPVSTLSKVPVVTPVEPIYAAVPVRVALSVKTNPEEVVVPETLALVYVWAEVVVVTPKVELVERAIAPALELPMLTAPVDVPVFMVVL